MQVPRQHPFVSPLGCLAALLLVAGLGVVIWLTGGALFSPGPLTAHASRGAPLEGFASHAEFEQDCARCHAAFRPVLAERCELCHTGVAAERGGQTGLHGALSARAAARCADCHLDHRGREFNPLFVEAARLERTGFDHAATSFALTTHGRDYSGAALACRDCHAGPSFAFEPEACGACHQAADEAFVRQHLRDYGRDCLVCHDGSGRLMAATHAQYFPLDGAHASVACLACHVDSRFQGTPTDCAACHLEPEVHRGQFGLACAECHTPQAWRPAVLPNHVFPLDHGKTGLLECATCHPSTFTEYTCYACHEHRLEEMIPKHAEHGITGPRLDDCAACHPDGRKEEEE